MEACRKSECASLSQLTLHRYLSAHEIHQPADDRQPQAGSAIEPGRRLIGLFKSLEHAGELVRGNADTGIRDAETQACFIGGQRVERNLHHDFALFGELYRIADQVDNDLPQAQRVSNDVTRNFGRHVTGQLQALFVRP